MPICITCSTPVKHLYTTYSKADDRSLGKGVRLTQCPNCKRFADKYVEHDFVVLFIDLVLIKPQVYRHLLFNRLGRSDDKLDPAILRLGILLVLFDVYITWARIEQTSSSVEGTQSSSKLSDLPILTQYLFFLTMNVVATIAQHGVIRGLARILLLKSHDAHSNTLHHEDTGIGGTGTNGYPSTSINPEVPAMTAMSPMTPSTISSPSTIVGNATSPINTNDPPHLPAHLQSQHQSIYAPTPSAISTALLVSSCTKLFPILLVIWPTSGSDDSTASSDPVESGLTSRMSNTFKSFFGFSSPDYVGWAVLLNNIEALLILLDCGYMIATGLAISGIFARWMVEGWFMSMVGAA